MGLAIKKRRLHLDSSSSNSKNADQDLLQQHQSSSSLKIECTSNAPQSSAAGIDMLLSAATLSRRVSHTDEDISSSSPSSPSLLRRGSVASTSTQPVVQQQLHAPRTAQVVTCGVCKDKDTNATSSISSLYQKMMTDRLSKANVASDQSSHLLRSSINSVMLPPSSKPENTQHTNKRSRIDRDTKVTSPYLVSECSSVNSEEDTNTVSSSSYARDDITLQEQRQQEISNQIQMYAYNELMRRLSQKLTFCIYTGLR